MTSIKDPTTNTRRRNSLSKPLSRMTKERHDAAQTCHASDHSCVAHGRQADCSALHDTVDCCLVLESSKSRRVALVTLKTLFQQNQGSSRRVQYMDSSSRAQDGQSCQRLTQKWVERESEPVKWFTTYVASTAPCFSLRPTRFIPTLRRMSFRFSQTWKLLVEYQS